METKKCDGDAFIRYFLLLATASVLIFGFLASIKMLYEGISSLPYQVECTYDNFKLNNKICYYESTGNLESYFCGTYNRFFNVNWTNCTEIQYTLHWKDCSKDYLKFYERNSSIPEIGLVCNYSGYCDVDLGPYDDFDYSQSNAGIIGGSLIGIMMIVVFSFIMYICCSAKNKEEEVEEEGGDIILDSHAPNIGVPTPE